MPEYKIQIYIRDRFAWLTQIARIQTVKFMGTLVTVVWTNDSKVPTKSHRFCQKPLTRNSRRLKWIIPSSSVLVTSGVIDMTYFG